MCEQQWEVFILDGKKRYTPDFQEFPQNIPGLLPRQTEYLSTGLYRNYIGTWEIIDRKLFLIRIRGCYKLCTKEPLFAAWVAGFIFIPEGRLMRDGNYTEPFSYRKVTCLKIGKGILEDIYIMDNRQMKKYTGGFKLTDPFCTFMGWSDDGDG